MAHDLPASLLEFIHGCIPTLQAAEVLLFVASHPGRSFTAEGLVVAMRPLVVTVPAVNDYLGQFVAAGLLVERQTGYAYGPTTSRLEQAVSELGRAYNERPVTLIAAIHRIGVSIPEGPGRSGHNTPRNAGSEEQER